MGDCLFALFQFYDRQISIPGDLRIQHTSRGRMVTHQNVFRYQHHLRSMLRAMIIGPVGRQPPSQIETRQIQGEYLPRGMLFLWKMFDFFPK